MKKNVPVCNFHTHFLRYYSVRSQETINEIDTKYLRLGVELKATFGLPSPDKVGGKLPDTFHHHSGPTFGFGFTIEA